MRLSYPPLLLLCTAYAIAQSSPPLNPPSTSLSTPPTTEPTPPPQHNDETSSVVEMEHESTEQVLGAAAEASAASVERDAVAMAASTSTPLPSPSTTSSSDTTSSSTVATPSTIPSTTSSPSIEPAPTVNIPTSPPSSDTTPTTTALPSPSTAIALPTDELPPPPAEKLPLTEVPAVPELLSFNEWKERYVVLPDPSHARRAKKAAQRARQDVVGASAAGAGAALYDGDGADLGSLFVKSEEAGLDGSVPHAEAGEEIKEIVTITPVVGPPKSDMASPIQPVGNAGTGEPSDPLLHLKDRSNYAAFECAAMVHRSSRQSKGASSILVEKKDRYMLTPCHAKPKFVDIELCDEIQIDTLVLANFEFFSSTFKHFKASCSVDYPGKPQDWHDLGTYRARNIRGVQVFRPNQNTRFCRYLRIDFLSHFGSEYYCPVSLLRVYGLTQLESYREAERKKKALQDALEAAELFEEEQEEQARQLDDMLLIEVENLERVVPAKEVKNVSLPEAARPLPPPLSETAPPSSPSPSRAASSFVAASSPTPSPHSSTALSSPTAISHPSSSFLDTSTSSSSLSTQLDEAVKTILPLSSSTTAVANPSSSTDVTPPTSSPTDSATSDMATSTITPPSSSSPHLPSTPPASTTTEYSTSSTVSSSPASSPSSSSVASASPTTFTPRSAIPTETHPVPTRHVLRDDSYYHPPHPPRPPVIPRAPEQPQPGESIYGTIMKRLTSLEHNQTLSMHFIEVQSSMLREAFGRVEKRLTEIEGSRGRQEQSLREGLLDLERQRVELERERLDLATQISLLNQEVRFEKRLTVAQLVALLLVVVFVAFTRGIPNSPFLHLAGGRSQRPVLPRKESKRKEEERTVAEREKEKEREKERERVRENEMEMRGMEAEMSGSDSRRAHRRAGSVSLGHRSANPTKRYPSLSKPGPRRHYGVGSTTPSKPLSAIRSPRPFAPPMRHSSAPPEEPFPSSAAAEAKEAARRRIFPNSARKPSSGQRIYEFPSRSTSEVDKTSGLAIDTSPALSGSPASNGDQFLSVPTSRRRNHLPPSSHADDADIEPSDSPALVNSAFDFDDADDERFGGINSSAPPLSPSASSPSPQPYVLTSGTTTDSELDEEHGYHTYSSAGEEEATARFSSYRPPPPPPLSFPPRALSPRNGSRHGRSGSSLKPPKPQVKVRPATSTGVPQPVFSPTNGKGKRRSEQEEEEREEQGYEGRISPSGLAVPLEPSSSTPSPPPEPRVVEVVVKQEEEEEGGESK